MNADLSPEDVVVEIRRDELIALYDATFTPDMGGVDYDHKGITRLAMKLGRWINESAPPSEDVRPTRCCTKCHACGSVEVDVNPSGYGCEVCN